MGHIVCSANVKIGVF